MKYFLAAILTMAYFSITGCSLSTVDAGEEGVMTYQPYIFGSGGVDANPIEAGSTWTAWSTAVDRYNIKPVKYKEHFIDLTASDNVAIDFDAYVTLQIVKGQSPKIHELSGVTWYENKVKDTVRAMVRNEARTRTSIDLRTNEVVINQVQDKILEQLRGYIKEIDLPVIATKVNLGKVVPPNEVLAEAAQTAAQKQRRQTQEQRKLAEETREAAERAAAIADKAYASQFKMTTDQFLRNKELDLMATAVEKGQVSLIMNSSDAVPMFSAK